MGHFRNLPGVRHQSDVHGIWRQQKFTFCVSTLDALKSPARASATSSKWRGTQPATAQDATSVSARAEERRSSRAPAVPHARPGCAASCCRLLRQRLPETECVLFRQDEFCFGRLRQLLRPAGAAPASAGADSGSDVICHCRRHGQRSTTLLPRLRPGGPPVWGFLIVVGFVVRSRKIIRN